MKKCQSKKQKQKKNKSYNTWIDKEATSQEEINMAKYM